MFAVVPVSQNRFAVAVMGRLKNRIAVAVVETGAVPGGNLGCLNVVATLSFQNDNVVQCCLA